MSSAKDERTKFPIESFAAGKEPAGSSASFDLKLRRWQVYFASGSGWYPAGEFVGVDAAAAIQRAIDVFGPASGYRAERGDELVNPLAT